MRALLLALVAVAGALVLVACSAAGPKAAAPSPTLSASTRTPVALLLPSRTPSFLISATQTPSPAPPSTPAPQPVAGQRRAPTLAATATAPADAPARLPRASAAERLPTSVTVAPAPDANAGHTFYASTARSARTIYCDTDPLWQTLNPRYRKSFPSLQAATAALPSYHLHQPC